MAHKCPNPKLQLKIIFLPVKLLKPQIPQFSARDAVPGLLTTRSLTVTARRKVRLNILFHSIKVTK